MKGIAAMRTGNLLAGLIVSALCAPAVFAEGTISMRGEGAVSAAPDIAIVRIGVESWMETAELALSRNSEQAQALIDAAKAHGIAPTDIRTEGLSLSPVYDNAAYDSIRRGREDGPKLEGFRAANGLTVRLRDISTAGELIGALVGAGANRIHGIEFGLADDQPQRDEARRAAVADAVRKAKLYAEAAGVALGPIVSIEEEGGGMQPRMLARAASDQYAAVPVEAGEASVSAAVRIVWRIAE